MHTNLPIQDVCSFLVHKVAVNFKVIDKTIIPIVIMFSIWFHEAIYTILICTKTIFSISTFLKERWDYYYIRNALICMYACTYICRYQMSIEKIFRHSLYIHMCIFRLEHVDGIHRIHNTFHVTICHFVYSRRTLSLVMCLNRAVKSKSLLSS